MKICTRCNLEKEDIDFNKNQAWCRLCQKEYRALYYEENKEEEQKHSKIYYENNKEAILEQTKYYQDNNLESVREYNKKYKENNKDYIREYNRNYSKDRRSIDSVFKLRKYVSVSIGRFMKSNFSTKNNKSITDYIPYSFEELKIHIENQFEPWMTWDNHGIYRKKLWVNDDPSTWRWQIDHIIPHSMLPYSSMEDENFKKCWALENLRPLSAKQNVLDGFRFNKRKEI